MTTYQPEQPPQRRQVPWRSVAFTLGVAAIALLMFSLGSRVNSNKDAILKGCVLLDNAIKQSQGGTAGGQVLISEILTNADQHNRPSVRLTYTEAVKDTKPLKPLNCKRLAEHPEEIVAIPLPKQTPAPKPPRVTPTPTATPK